MDASRAQRCLGIQELENWRRMSTVEVQRKWDHGTAYVEDLTEEPQQTALVGKAVSHGKRGVKRVF